MYRKKTHLHFVGIGGIGMSGIAKILRTQGYQISGCDLDIEQKSVKELVSLNCTVSQGHQTPLCLDQSIDVIVYSSDVKADSPELLAAQARGIPTIRRGLMLAELMRAKYSIAIAGSHGKTTTTSMISHILIEAGLDPTVIIGGHLKNISANARPGSGEFIVAESDESDRSFLYLSATFGVVTNIDLEHLDTYHDLQDIKDTFRKFLNNIPFYGKAILCVDDENVRSLLPMPHLKTIKYSLADQSALADIWAEDVNLQPDSASFAVHDKKRGSLGSISISMLGRHNVLNSLAATALALELGVPFTTIAQALASFTGIDRRFTHKGSFNGAQIFDDYGHHPTEIYNTLQVARMKAQKSLTMVFQPHRYTRTHKLWKEFVDLLARAPIDNLIITDIHSAHEQPIEGVTSHSLVSAIIAQQPHCKVTYVPLDASFEAILATLKPLVHPNDLILLQGAGKITKLAEKLINY
jgi:UDP-N-acetylmuramate--alanine ligase